MAIISAAIGRVSLILIVVIIYFMTRPVDNVAPLQDKASSSFVSNVYFSSKEGFSFQDLVAATNRYDEMRYCEYVMWVGDMCRFVCGVGL